MEPTYSPNNQWSTAVTAAGASIGNNDDVRWAKELALRGETIARKAGRIATEAEIRGVMAELRAQREQLAEGYARKARKQAGTADAILSILRQGALFVKTSGFGNPDTETEMKARLRSQLDTDMPVMLPLLMGGAKVANPIKTGGQYLPDLSEWISWSTLEAIGLAIQAVYQPGAQIVVVPDAALHTADLGMPIEETLAHAAAAQTDLRRLGLRHVVIPDVLPYLDSAWVEGVQGLVTEARRQAQMDPAALRGQVESLLYSVNTRVQGRRFEELLLVYAALAGHLEGLPDAAIQEAREMRRRTEAVGFHYEAVNWTIRQLRLVERIVADLTGSPDHLRMSVHAKPGEPRPALFASSSQFPSIGGLLPMHAVGVRLLGEDKTRYGAAFELAGRLRGWTPVTEGERFLWFEGK
jgi:pyoverdine/dityrosine biosynthesis protein Dit1